MTPSRPAARNGADSDAIWRALANPQRRAILAALRDGPRPTTYLVQLFPALSRFAVLKHLALLREVGMIQTKDEGRQKMNSLNAVPIRLVYEELVDDYKDLWARKLIKVKQRAEEKS